MDRTVPTPTKQQVGIIRVPFEAEHSVLVRAQMPILNLNWVALIQMPEKDLALLPTERIVGPFRVDLTRLHHCGILIYF